MKKIGIVLNLYQPITQEENKLREIYDLSFSPILRAIKNRKDFRPTLNIPLGILQRVDLAEIKGYLEEDRVELIGSTAYNAVLMGLPETLATNEIVLNEYGIGYFFGRRSGFEGESAVLIKGLKGFFPPKFSYDKKTFELIQSLGYEWVLSDPFSTDGKSGVFKVENSDLHILSFNTDLSARISGLVDANIDNIAAEIETAEDNVIVLDVEFFGYKNRDGIYLLNKLLDKFQAMNIEIVTASEFVEEELDESRFAVLTAFKEHSYQPDNKTLWDLNQSFVKVLENYLASVPKLEVEGMENIPVWKEDLPREIRINILAAQVCDCSQFENRGLSKRFLDLYSQLAELLADETLIELVKKAQTNLE